MRRAGSMLGAIALLGLCCAGAVSAPAASPSADGWSADPEAQFLLDVNIRRLRLGDGVRAYATPQGSCIVFGDFLTALDVPMTVDLRTKTATGWAFREQHKIRIDAASATVTYGEAQEAIAPGTIRETPEGWCVDTGALARWFGIKVKPNMNASALMLESEAKLPVELAMERQKRAERIKPAKFDLSSLPQVRLPYRMWRAPVLDFVVSGGVTYRAHDGVRVDRRTALYAAGEIARLSYDAQVSTDDRGRPAGLRLRAYRSEPEGGLLGPLNATHFGFGDVSGFDSRLSGNAANGRGGVVTNRPLAAQTSFDRTRFEGDLPSGWDAEIYRNGELLAFAKPGSDQRYVFEDVQLLYGENRISIVLYGPQGQIRTREELINVGQDHVPPGKTWWWVGGNQPGRDLVALDKPPDDPNRPAAQAAVSVEHGLDARTSVGALARTMLVEDERLTFVEGTVRRSIGRAMVELSVAGESGGGKAARAQVLARVGNVNISAEAVSADDFHLRGGRSVSVRDARLRVDAPLRIGRTVLPAHANVRYTDTRDGASQLEAAARLSANIRRFNLATDVKYRKQYLRSGPAPPDEVNLALLGSGRVGDVRIRGGTSFDITPEARFRSAELSAYWSASERTDWEAGVVYDSLSKRARGRISHIRRLDSIAIALTGEADSDGSVALGFNLNFSLDPARGMSLSRLPLASAGAIHARVYRDLNDNGVRDPSEPLEKGALVTTGQRLVERPTDSNGSVLVGGLSAFVPIAVGIDQTSLEDPMLVPKKALQVVVPRPGVPADVEIGLVGGGDIEGAVVKSGGLGFEGLELELIGADGRRVASARSDFDGFFLFERVPYGEYRIRIAAESAAAARIVSDLGVSVSVSAEKSVARVGAIPVQPLPRLAAIAVPATP